MKIFHKLLAAVAFVFLLTAPVSTATAGSMGNGAAQRQKLVIDSIDEATGAVTFKSGVDQSVHSYKIEPTTRISIVNVKGTIDQIKVGMKVANYAVKPGQTGEGQTLSFLSVYSPPPSPVPGAAQ